MNLSNSPFALGGRMVLKSFVLCKFLEFFRIVALNSSRSSIDYEGLSLLLWKLVDDTLSTIRYLVLLSIMTRL